MKDRLKRYDELKAQNDSLLTKIRLQDEQIKKLKEQKKDMSMNYSKELSANKLQQVAHLRSSNEKYLTAADFIQVSFFNELTGLEDEVRQMLEHKLDQVKEQAHEKIASLIQENERKETQIAKYK